MSASNQQLPVHGGPEKRAYVRSMFTAIAPTYDRLNRIISLNFDRRWRRRAVQLLGWERAPAGTYLDLCAGTLDFAAILATQPGFRGRVVCADFVAPMLRLGLGKAEGLAPVTADALQLPFADASFDGVTVGWGVRNLIDLDAGLREVVRVLRPGGRLTIVEMSQPEWQPFRAIFDAYFTHVLPAIGRAVSKHRNAYRWLPESTRVFPNPRALAARMEQAGFAGVHFERLLGGACALHVGARA
jgi:demethylmenaquinone methyltransferase/2-methoxy-6-polyprenyl-1,4-benzoquinol methylase